MENTTERFKLKNGNDIRLYNFNGIDYKFPSVTTITNFVEKDWLAKWRANNKRWKEAS